MNSTVFAAALVEPSLPGATLLNGRNVSSVSRPGVGVYVLTLIDGLGIIECFCQVTEKATGGASVGVMTSFELAADEATLTVRLKDHSGAPVDASFSLIVDRLTT